MSRTHTKRKALTSAAALASLIAVPALALSPFSPPSQTAVVGTDIAYADELSDAQSALSAKTDELAELETQSEALSEEVSSLSGEIDGIADDMLAVQSEAAKLTDALADVTSTMYKTGGDASLIAYLIDAENVEDFAQRAGYLERYASGISSMLAAKDAVLSELEAKKAELDAKVSERQAKADELAAQIAPLEDEVSELKSEVSELSASSGAIASTFATGDTSGWLSGTASAYGGSTDSSTGAVATTATGARCDDSSMGVAVPMSMPNYRSYFGRKVEISYNGRSVIATVNDCGGMGGGSRVLDLQPGVFKALGFSSCNAWGLRTVSYRFL